MTVLGVDPGLSGALARFDRSTGALEVQDMPVFYMTVGKKKRGRVDAVALAEYFDMEKCLGAELCVIEAVGGRPSQSASAGFVFGYTVGLIYMACINSRIPVETVSPQAWKGIMGLKGKKQSQKELIAQYSGEKPVRKQKEVDGEIIQRADELMPDHRDIWRGPQGGYKLDRAEAALLALYGGRYALDSVKKANVRDPEWSLAYRNADVGA